MNISTPVKVVLGAVLVALAAFNAYIDTTVATHTAIAIVTTSFAAVGIGPALGSQLGKLIPLPVAHALGLAVALGNAVVQNVSGLSAGVTALISAALVFLVGIGIQPVSIPVAQDAPVGPPSAPPVAKKPVRKPRA